VNALVAARQTQDLIVWGCLRNHHWPWAARYGSTLFCWRRRHTITDGAVECSLPGSGNSRDPHEVQPPGKVQSSLRRESLSEKRTRGTGIFRNKIQGTGISRKESRKWAYPETKFKEQGWPEKEQTLGSILRGDQMTISDGSFRCFLDGVGCNVGDRLGYSLLFASAQLERAGMLCDLVRYTLRREISREGIGRLDMSSEHRTTIEERSLRFPYRAQQDLPYIQKASTSPMASCGLKSRHTSSTMHVEFRTYSLRGSGNKTRSTLLRSNRKARTSARAVHGLVRTSGCSCGGCDFARTSASKLLLHFCSRPAFSTIGHLRHSRSALEWRAELL
jgi:hypothetical protein